MFDHAEENIGVLGEKERGNVGSAWTRPGLDSRQVIDFN